MLLQKETVSLISEALEKQVEVLSPMHTQVEVNAVSRLKISSHELGREKWWGTGQ